MRRVDEIFDQIVLTTKKHLGNHIGHGYITGGNMDAIVKSIAVAVAEAIFDTMNTILPTNDDPMPSIHARFEQFAGLIKMLGDQVAEHNAALLMLTAPAEPERPRMVQCYCGWKHTGGQCVVCGREQASGFA